MHLAVVHSIKAHAGSLEKELAELKKVKKLRRVAESNSYASFVLSRLPASIITRLSTLIKRAGENFHKTSAPKLAEK